MQTEKQKPVHVIKRGAIRAACWQQQGQYGPFINVTITRRFKTDSGRGWDDSSSFTHNQLLVVAEVAREAYHYACEHSQKHRKAEGEGEDDSDPSNN